MKHDRLFQLLYLLLEQKTTTAPELAKKLEVSVRTIYRDVDALSACGIPIYALSGKNGGISLMSDYVFDHSLLTDSEQNEMLFALQSLQATDQGTDILLSKLGTVFKKQNPNWIEVDFSRWGHKKVDAEKFNTLRHGILHQQLISIAYLDSYGRKSDRTIQPLKLIFKQSNWYLQAFCRKANDFRTFKINRMASIALCDEYCNDVFDDIPAINSPSPSAQELCTMQLRVSPKMAFRVYDEFLPADVITDDDGNLLVTATLPVDGWIYSYILSFGDQIEILEPKWLHESMIKYIETLYHHFKP